MANRWKKEETRKKKEARIGLSFEEINDLDAVEEAEEKLLEEITKFHIKLFPEEYDHMGDSITDANERRRGTNPMSDEYIERTNERRKKLGFGPVSLYGPEQDTLCFVREKLERGDRQGLTNLLQKFCLS